MKATQQLKNEAEITGRSGEVDPATGVKRLARVVTDLIIVVESLEAEIDELTSRVNDVEANRS